MKRITLAPSYLIGVLLILFFLLVACEQRPLRPDQRAKVLQSHIRPGLSSVSPELALFDANNQFSRMNHCAINSSVDWASTLCNVFQSSETFTSNLVQIVMQSQKELRNGYLFYVKPGTKNNELILLGLIITESQEEPIGLFETEHECSRSKDAFRKNGIQVKACRPWKEEYIGYRVFDTKEGKERVQYFNYLGPEFGP